MNIDTKSYVITKSKLYIVLLVIRMFFLIRILQNRLNVHKINFDTYMISIKTGVYKNMRFYINIHFN
jgi:hypothetical protein